MKPAPAISRPCLDSICGKKGSSISHKAHELHADTLAVGYPRDSEELGWARLVQAPTTITATRNSADETRLPLQTGALLPHQVARDAPEISAAKITDGSYVYLRAARG